MEQDGSHARRSQPVTDCAMFQINAPSPRVKSLGPPPVRTDKKACPKSLQHRSTAYRVRTHRKGTVRRRRTKIAAPALTNRRQSNQSPKKSCRRSRHVLSQTQKAPGRALLKFVIGTGACDRPRRGKPFLAGRRSHCERHSRYRIRRHSHYRRRMNCHSSQARNRRSNRMLRQGLSRR